jgi:non-ribosomal peptide synthetase component E (peptide arylation enzyme)
MHQEANLAELHGVQPQEPLPTLWPHFVGLTHQFGKRQAAVSLHQGLSWSYSDMFDRVEELSARLVHLGLQKGAVIAVSRQ